MTYKALKVDLDRLSNEQLHEEVIIYPNREYNVASSMDVHRSSDRLVKCIDRELARIVILPGFDFDNDNGNRYKMIEQYDQGKTIITIM